ncbi:hypothetical protein NC653_009565 [Populus alba x Populus x berolinensis]|uniref:Uncharacterized protein n=1 Tax=Populus alba x Populus x berolinensis TaxID=444605 RepID=A0AAD6WBR8_9ROSI|nr:hypothetical protein NC653_009565 [Populus alba x Populus x berolinensis]
MMFFCSCDDNNEIRFWNINQYSCTPGDIVSQRRGCIHETLVQVSGKQVPFLCFPSLDIPLSWLLGEPIQESNSCTYILLDYFSTHVWISTLSFPGNDTHCSNSVIGALSEQWLEKQVHDGVRLHECVDFRLWLNHKLQGFECPLLQVMTNV